MSILSDYARNELEIAGWFGDDSDYGGLVGNAVMELIDVFSEQGHSGSSAPLISHLFSKLVAYENLTEISENPSEWSSVDDGRYYQSKRNPAIFSDDGLKTWYHVDNRDVIIGKAEND